MPGLLKRFLFIIFGLFIHLTVYSQTPDDNIEKLISEGDFFELNRVYPQTKDSLSHFMSSYTRTILYFYFYNSPETVIMECNDLLNKYNNQLPPSYAMYIMSYKAQSLAGLNKYSEAAQILETLIKQYSKQMNQRLLSDCQSAIQRYKAMVSFPSLKIERPAKTDCQTTILFDSVGEGEQLQIKAKLQGKDTYFVFDTGASFNIMTESFAKRNGIKTTNKNIIINGIGGQNTAKLGLVDSLELGEMKIRNIVFAIVPDSEINNYFIGEKANVPVLGMPVIRETSEVRIFPQERKIVFPHRQSPLLPSGSNLMVVSSQPYIEIQTNSDRLVTHFDTGSSVDKFSSRYYLNNKSEVDIIGKMEKLRTGGVGGIRFTDSYILPEINFKVIDKEIIMKDFTVDTEPDIFTKNTDGVLGVGFIKACKSILINFNKMFVYAE